MMMNKLAALAALIAYASATYSGFNYGSTNTDGSAVTQAEFESLFRTAQALPNTNGQFTAARLYTMIQAGTANGVISAIPAAINTNTYLLLGMWASAGQANFDNEIAALTAAINQYGTALTSRIAGISVGSEDLYRISPTGIINMSGAGADPATLVNYINQVRAAIAGTAAASAPITHVDTWTAWANGTNAPVAQAVDFLSMDAYPYFENTTPNGIENGMSKLYAAIGQTQAAAPGKQVWVTETGWPVSGPTMNQAVASVANAKTYWDDVQCTLKGNYNMFWYTLQDSYPNPPPPPSFGIIGSNLNSPPLFDLSCPVSSTSSSAVSTSTTSSVVSSSGAAVSTSASTSTIVSASAVPTVSGVASSILASTTPASSSTSPLPVVSTATTAAFSLSTTASLSSTDTSIFGSTRSIIPVSSAPAAASSSAPAAASNATSIPAAAAGSVASSISSAMASASSAAMSAASALSSATSVSATAGGSAKTSASLAGASASSALSSASAALSSASAAASSAAAAGGVAATSRAATSGGMATSTARASASATVSPYVPGNGAGAVVPGVLAAAAGVFAYVL